MICHVHSGNAEISLRRLGNIFRLQTKGKKRETSTMLWLYLEQFLKIKILKKKNLYQNCVWSIDNMLEKYLID